MWPPLIMASSKLASFKIVSLKNVLLYKERLPSNKSPPNFPHPTKPPTHLLCNQTPFAIPPPSSLALPKTEYLGID